MPAPLKTRREVQKRFDAEGLRVAGVATGGPVLTEPLAVPRDVRLGETPDAEPAILWCVPPDADRHGATQDWARGGTGAQAFWRFLDLADKQQDTQFVAFAKRFGVLGLWDYRTPKGSKIFGIDYWVPSITEGIYTPQVDWDHTVYRRLKAEGRDDKAEQLTQTRYEPIAEWRRWATWFKAAINIAFALNEGRPGRVQDWIALDWDVAVTVKDGHGGRRMVSVDVQRRELMRVIQGRFLKWSGLVPTIRWGDNGPGVSLALGGKAAIHMPRWSMQFDWPSNSLYPALVAGLLSVLSFGTPLGACSQCGKVFPMTRKPRVDREAYCSDEHRKEAKRLRDNDSARKRRAEGRKT